MNTADKTLEESFNRLNDKFTEAVTSKLKEDGVKRIESTLLTLLVRRVWEEFCKLN